MGWTSTRRPAGQDTLDFFKNEFRDLFTRVDVVAHNATRSAFYAACRDKNTGEVWALVVATERTPGAYWNYSYKEMDETCGPYEAHPSKAVLDALTPTTSEYAIEWRAKARANLNRKQAKVGDTIRFPGTLSFGGEDPFTEDTFKVDWVRRYRRSGEPIKKTVLVSASTGIRVRIPNWRTRVYAIV